jgi:starvation-inducible DNA-binding protein
LFDKLAGELEQHVDLIAERVTALGGVAMGTVRMAAQRSRVPEYDVAITDSQPVVDALAVRFANVAATTRRAVEIADEQGDHGTADLLTEVSRALDKALWFLEAHSQR